MHHGKIVKITKEVEDEPGKHKKGYQNTFLSLFWLSVVIKKIDISTFFYSMTSKDALILVSRRHERNIVRSNVYKLFGGNDTVLILRFQ